MKIAISGCGITGTATALQLAQLGHDVTVFEQADHCSSIGAGILISPQGQLALQRLGILDEVLEHSERLVGMRAQHLSGRTLVELCYHWLRPELFGLGVHRGRLFETLLNGCRKSGVEIVNGFATEEVLTGAESSILLRSSTGIESGAFDFVIATDGLRSRLRATCNMKFRVIEYDYAALWATAPCSFQPGKLIQYVDGTRRLLGLLPIGNGASSFFWGLRADSLEDLKSGGFDKWRNEVMLACPDAESVFETIDSFDDLTFARYRHVTMSRCHRERVIFLGDAGHATSPHLGQGANLGLEDAVDFSDALEQTDNMERAFELFAGNRRRKIRYYQQLTRLLTPFFQSDGFPKSMLRNLTLPWMPHLPIVRREMLRTLCGFKNGWLG